MTRLLPLLTLASVPALVAAPVPPEAPPAFGESGLLTRADLERVRFDSRAMKLDGRAEDREDVREEKDLEDVRRRDEPEKPRPANRFDVAVHMSRRVFREGEPIPAYLVLRNNRPSTLGLNSRIDLSGVFPKLQGGAIEFDVRDRATGKSVIQGLSCSTNCGGGSLIDVPADGYFVTRGDLSRVSGTGFLPPGDYEVEWGYRPLRSAPVRFSVAVADGPKPVAPPRPLAHFLRLSEGGEREERLRVIGEPVVWRETHLEGVHPDAMAAALAVGQNGVHVPDLHAIPAADKMVEAWMEWHPYREGDRVVVTLRARPPYREVLFDELPQLHLQIESPRDTDRRGWAHSACGDLKAMAQESLATPLTIDARLPKGWRESVGVAEAARVAVLVTSKPLELPTRGERIRRLEKLVVRLEHAARPPVWSGTVRTEFVELHFPPRGPLTRE